MKDVDGDEQSVAVPAKVLCSHEQDHLIFKEKETGPVHRIGQGRRAESDLVNSDTRTSARA